MRVDASADVDDEVLYEGVERLDLSNNGSVGVVPPFVWRMRVLASLYLASNQLGSLDDRFALLGALRVLDVSNNRLSSLRPLRPLVRLATLIADRNCVAPDTMPKLPNLEHLSLAANDLTVLPPAIVECERLLLVNVADNRLTALPELTRLTSLEHLDAHHNRLSALPASAQLSTLVTLNVAHNSIAVLPDALATYYQLQVSCVGVRECVYVSINVLT
jgi:hypothetical protein